MSIGYKKLICAIGMIALPLTAAPRDPRVARLHGFLVKLRCPIAGMSEDFVRAADKNNLDWRLLPSIALIESSGGKAYKNNNIFGWNGGEQAFSSIRSGLDLVAYKLGRSSLYKRLDSIGKLHRYNENKQYATAVLAVMKRISPDQPSIAEPVVNDFALALF